MSEKTYYTDKQMQEVLEMKPSTMRKYLREGVPRTKYGRAAVDIRLIPHTIPAGKRRWNKAAVDRVASGLPLQIG